MPPVAISSPPVSRRKRATPKTHQGTPDVLRCHCPRCSRTGRVWPSYYVGLWIWMERYSAPPKEWRVRWLSFDCYLDDLEPDLNPDAGVAPATDQQALDEGLSVRDPGRRSIWAPLLQGDCEACGELREARLRFCMNCQAKVREACEKVGWAPELVTRYLRAPVNGRDDFADGTLNIVRT